MSPPGRPKGEYRSAKREGSPMSMRGRARSAGARITQKRNHGRAMPARPSSLGEVTQ
jgi:hypothetical protein